MKDRIQALMSDKEITSARLAGVIGVQPSAISHILSGRNKPGFDLLTSLLRGYPDVNPTWLMLGDGDMYIDSSNRTTQEASPHSITNSAQKSYESNDLNNRLITNVIVKEEASIESRERVGGGGDKGIDRVIIFYEDGTFKEYSNK